MVTKISICGHNNVRFYWSYGAYEGWGEAIIISSFDYKALLLCYRKFNTKAMLELVVAKTEKLCTLMMHYKQFNSIQDAPMKSAVRE